MFVLAPIGAAFAAILATCGDVRTGGEARVVATFTLPDTPLAKFQNAKLPNSIANDRKILLGGIGSDLWRSPSDAPDELWMVTDRGPNGKVDTKDGSHRTFVVPEYTPTILRVRCAKDSIEILDALPLVGRSKKGVGGLPNVASHDEIPYGFDGEHELAVDPSGLDIEGLVRAKAGDFWLVEEYAPSLVHVDANGTVLTRFVPSDSKIAGADYDVKPALPAILGKRKENRGFEGVALSSDEKTVYLVVQSPLSNPDKKTGEHSRTARILAFDVASEKPIAEYAYRFDVATEFTGDASAKADDMKISGLVARDAKTLLVLERTDDVAKLYAADIGRATNLLGTPWDDAKTSPSLESLADLGASKVDAAPKKLVVDFSKLANVPRKLEGVAVLDAKTIAIANDNDFDVGKFDAQGNNVGKGVKSKVLVIALPEALP